MSSLTRKTVSKADLCQEVMEGAYWLAITLIRLMLRSPNSTAARHRCGKDRERGGNGEPAGGVGTSTLRPVWRQGLH